MQRSEGSAIKQGKTQVLTHQQTVQERCSSTSQWPHKPGRRRTAGDESRSAAVPVCPERPKSTTGQNGETVAFKLFPSPLPSIAGPPCFAEKSWAGSPHLALDNSATGLSSSATLIIKRRRAWRITPVPGLKEKHMVRNVKILTSPEIPLIQQENLERADDSAETQLWTAASPRRGLFCWETIRRDKKRTQLTTKLSNEDECVYQWSAMNLWCALEEQRSHA